MTVDEIGQLWRRYKQGSDQAVRDRLILTYAPLVKYVAGRLGSGLPSHVDESDLVSYGLLGLIDAIERYDPRFGSRVLHRAVWSPFDLEERFGLREGAASQGELGLDQILFMRPVAGYGRYTTPIAGLYLGGAGSHPGPGILGGAGHLAANQVIRDRKGQRRRAS